jgi:hypothetical protein
MAKHRRSRKQQHLYVYGIVPADVSLADDVEGVGDPPGRVDVIREGEVGALVSAFAEHSRALGTPEDLRTHATVLDGAAGQVPVLPIRFGAVLHDEQAVRSELLGPHHDDFLAALEELDGKAEYVVRGRYDSDAVLREVLDENDEARRLRDRIRELPEDASRPDRIALGELVNEAISRKRAEDTQRVVDALAEHTVRLTVREPTHEQDAAYVACLVETSNQEQLETALDELAREWAGRVELRLLGPLAAYDFVTTAQG